MNIEQQLEEISLTIEQARSNVERWKALQRLYENTDFDMVFMEGYLVHEAARSARALAEPQLQKPEHQRLLKNNIKGVGSFQQYLKSVRQFGMMAESAIEESEGARQELLAQQLEGENINRTNGAGFAAGRQDVFDNDDVEDNSPTAPYTV